MSHNFVFGRTEKKDVHIIVYVLQTNQACRVILMKAVDIFVYTKCKMNYPHFGLKFHVIHIALGLLQGMICSW